MRLHLIYKVIIKKNKHHINVILGLFHYQYYWNILPGELLIYLFWLVYLPANLFGRQINRLMRKPVWQI